MNVIFKTYKKHELNDHGFTHLALPLLAVVLIAFIGGSVYLHLSSADSLTKADYLHSGIAGKCLDDWHDGTTEGTTVDLYVCNKTAAQQWTLTSEINDTDLITNANGTCLDNWKAKGAAGNPIRMYRCNPTDGAQLWRTAGNILMNPMTGMCIEDPGSTTTNGTPLRLYACDGQPDQQWTRVPVGTKTTTPPPPPAPTAPTITITKTTIGTTTATITWTTNQSTTSWLRYNYTTPLTAATLTSAAGTVHTVTIGNLKADTHYPYEISATNSAKKTTLSIGHSFTTTAVTVGGGGTGGNTPTPVSDVSCTYRDNTWDQGDATALDYKVTDLSHANGNPASFSIELNAQSTNKQVVAYPDDQCILTEAIPSALTSSFNITPPANSSGLDYEFAYDFWINTAAAIKSSNPWANNQEIMIWTYNHGQTPSGSVEGKLSDGSTVYGPGTTTNGVSAVSVVLPQNETSGTVDLVSILSQLRAKGIINSSDTGIDDVEYGIEAPYGGGQTFTVNSFSVGE